LRHVETISDHLRDRPDAPAKIFQNFLVFPATIGHWLMPTCAGKWKRGQRKRLGPAAGPICFAESGESWWFPATWPSDIDKG